MLWPQWPPCTPNIWSEYRRVFFQERKEINTQTLIPINTLDREDNPQFIHSATYTELLELSMSIAVLIFTLVIGQVQISPAVYGQLLRSVRSRLPTEHQER